MKVTMHVDVPLNDPAGAEAALDLLERWAQLQCEQSGLEPGRAIHFREAEKHDEIGRLLADVSTKVSRIVAEGNIARVVVYQRPKEAK